jgi:hypothetical protein
MQGYIDSTTVEVNADVFLEHVANYFFNPFTARISAHGYSLF